MEIYWHGLLLNGMMIYGEDKPIRHMHDDLSRIGYGLRSVLIGMGHYRLFGYAGRLHDIIHSDVRFRRRYRCWNALI